MKAEPKNINVEAYECLARDKGDVKRELHLRKNENQRHREVEKRLKRSEGVSMPRLARIKSAEDDHDQYNVVCE